MSYQDNSIFQNIMAYNRNDRNDVLKKLKPSERLLAEIKEFGFELSQLETVMKCRGNQLVLSCAGSGKTTALIFKVIYDQKTGYATKQVEVNGNKVRVTDSTWVCTFLKSGAEELKSSLVKWQRRLHCVDTASAIQFSTLHAEFKRALNSMGITTNIISEADNMKYLKDIVKTYCIMDSNNKPLNSEQLRDLQGALTYTRNRLDSSRYLRDTYEEFNIAPKMVDAILRDWKDCRRKDKVCDFEDLQEMLYNECYVKNNAEVINYLSNRYNFIYIDEFQDTSQIQYALIKIYASKCRQLVAIGDDDQTIYSWRGSYNGIITREFMEDFHPTKNDLSINYRCPENVLNAIKPSISCNKDRFEKDLVSYKKGGKVRYGGYVNYKHMVSALSDLVMEDIKADRSVAILCRVNSDGLMPALILDKLNNISFSISGEGMTLDSYIGRTVINIVKLFTERTTPAVRNALGYLTWNTYLINNLLRVCKNNQMSIWSVDEKDLVYSCPEISDRILAWRRWRKEKGDLAALKCVLQDYRVNVFCKDTQFNDVVKSVLFSVETLLDYYDYDYVEDFLSELEDINERLKARKKKTGMNVCIATVHEYKGKEADSVYVWNDSEDVFPYRGTDEILEEFEEERRIHYIANTRAREVNTIMYLKSKPGYFIQEMDFSNAECLEGSVTSGESMIKLGERMKEESGLNKFKNKFVETEEFKDDDDGTEDNPFWEGVEED